MNRKNKYVWIVLGDKNIYSVKSTFKKALNHYAICIGYRMSKPDYWRLLNTTTDTSAWNFATGDFTAIGKRYKALDDELQTPVRCTNFRKFMSGKWDGFETMELVRVRLT